MVANWLDWHNEHHLTSRVKNLTRKVSGPGVTFHHLTVAVLGVGVFIAALFVDYNIINEFWSRALSNEFGEVPPALATTVAAKSMQVLFGTLAVHYLISHIGHGGRVAYSLFIFAITAVMIVVLALLDDIPIMTIAYDNTPVSERPIRWRMPRLLSVSTVLGSFSVMQAFGLLLIGLEILSNPAWQAWFALADRAHLQTAVFLQLGVGGHLLLFVTRTERWFFRPPYPALPLLGAIVATQIVAALMCGFGWLVPSISWRIVALVWAYNVLWMFVLGAVRLATERTIDNRTRARRQSGVLVTQPLQTHLPAPARNAIV